MSTDQKNPETLLMGLDSTKRKYVEQKKLTRMAGEEGEVTSDVYLEHFHSFFQYISELYTQYLAMLLSRTGLKVTFSLLKW